MPRPKKTNKIPSNDQKANRKQAKKEPDYVRGIPQTKTVSKTESAPIIDAVISQTSRRSQISNEPAGFTVDYLPDYPIGGAGKDAPRIPCGQVTGLDNVTAEIAARFLPKLNIDHGYFRLRPHREDGTFMPGPPVVEHVYAMPLTSEDDETDEDDDIGDMDDAAELLTPAEIKLKIENERLKATLQAKNGHGGGVVELIQALKELRSMEPQNSFREKLQEFRMYQELINPQRENPEQSTENGTESALARLLASDDEVIDKVVGKFKGLLRRGDGAGNETSWMDLALEAIKNDTLPKLINMVFTNVKQIQAQAITGQQQQTTAVNVPQASQTPGVQSIPTNPQASPMPTNAEEPKIESAIISEQQVMSFALNQIMAACSRNEKMIPVINWLIEYEQKYPSVITPLIDQFMTMSADQVIVFLNAMPNGSTYTQLPSCKNWIEDLQKAIKESTEEEGKEVANAAKT
jgi:hypothetical protein